MADTQTPQTPAPAREPWLHTLARNRKQAAYVLFAVAIALGALAIWLGAQYGLKLWPLSAWCAGVALIGLTGGLWILLYEPGASPALDAVRFFALLVGGSAGLVTVLLGLVLGYMWWTDILMLTQSGGPDPSLDKSERTLMVVRAMTPMPILVLGLAIMFVSLLLSRTDERASPVMRRSLYGYNAVLQGVLVLLILIVGNVFITLKTAKPLDFTNASFYTISPQTEAILRSLPKTAKVYVLLPGNDPLVQSLLENCQAITDKLEVETVSPNPDKDPIKHAALKKYGDLVDEGLLVTYGPEKEDARLIKATDLYKGEMDEKHRRQTVVFRGEDALMTELDYLAHGRKKSVIYFTQGNGELDLKNSNPSPEVRNIDKGAGVLRDRLQKRNVEIKELKLTLNDSKIPDDAALVVVAGPRSTLPDYAVKALDQYLASPRGRLLFMAEVVPTRDGKMQPTGLEEMLGKYNVQLPPERVLNIPNNIIPGYLQVLAQTNPGLESGMGPQRDPSLLQLAAAFKNRNLMMYDARPVRPTPNRPGMSRFTAETLLIGAPAQPLWAETNLDPQLSVVMEQYRRDQDELKKKINAHQRQQPISLAVAVTESAGGGINPHTGQPMPGGEVTPRLVVIGDASMASNPLMSEESGTLNFDFLASTIDWLRGRSNSIGITAKRADLYALPTGTSYWPFVMLPALVICLGVVGTGTGVWLVRRR